MSAAKRINSLILATTAIFLVGVLAAQAMLIRKHFEQEGEAYGEYIGVELLNKIMPFAGNYESSAIREFLTQAANQKAVRGARLTDGVGYVIFNVRDEKIETDAPSWLTLVIPIDFPRARVTKRAFTGVDLTLEIEPSPGEYYAAIWETTLIYLCWAIAIAIGAQVVAGVVFGHLRAGIRELEKQAEGISHNRFAQLTADNYDGELDRLVAVCNKMTTHVERVLRDQTSLADQLRNEAYTDAITGLGNRRAFDMRLQGMMLELDAPHFGALVIVRISALKDYNDRYGVSSGDELLRSITEITKQAFAFQTMRLVARISGSDIAVFAPGVDLKDVKQECEKMCTRLSQIQTYGEKSVVCHVGASLYRDKQDITELATIADAAVRSAQQKGPFTWSLSASEGTHEKQWLYDSKQWRELMSKVLSERLVVLLAQPVVDSASRRIIHREIFVRVPDEKNRLIPAGVVMPAVERMGLAPTLDRIVIEKLIQRLQEGNHDEVPFAVNLSASSITSQEFLDWLYGAMLITPQLASYFVFEISEFTLQSHLELARQVVQRLHVLGASTSIDHFGMGVATIGYVSQMAIDYLKLDGGYIRDLAQNQDNRNIVRVFKEVTRQLQAKVIAEAVENEDDWQAVRELGLDGGRGYYLGRPQVLDDATATYYNEAVT